MIRLDTTTDHFLKELFPDISAYKERVIVKTEKDSITLPSHLYPIQNKKHIRLFSAANTQTVVDESVRVIFDSINFKVGYCYSNTQMLQDALIDGEIAERDLQAYAGWILIHSVPVHHCWLVYKDNHVLDGGIHQTDMAYFKEIQDRGITDLEEQRQVLARLMRESKNLPNSQLKTFGQVVPLYLYVGSKATPDQGRVVFQELMQRHPNHPTYARPGMNGMGESRMQEIIRLNT